MQKEKISVDLGKVIPVSTVDWYKKSACMVFFNKCPFKCIWCQNHKLLENTNIVDMEIAKKKIEESMDFVSAVVFSGGEPTLQDNALDILTRFTKRNELLVGLQTNGYYPSVIRKLIGHNLLDKIFLDIKASDTIKYQEITGVEDAYNKVVESFNIINMSSVTSEIRTTVFKSFTNDVFDIAAFLESRNYRGTYVLQTGIPNNAPDGNIRNDVRIHIYEMQKMAKKITRDTGINTKFT